MECCVVAASATILLVRAILLVPQIERRASIPGICGRVEIQYENVLPEADSYYMQSVLFKTNKPTEAEGRVEFCIVSLSWLGPNGKISVVQEIHGGWNNGTRMATFDREFES